MPPEFRVYFYSQIRLLKKLLCRAVPMNTVLLIEVKATKEELGGASV